MKRDSKLVPLVIPTRNRPMSLGFLLNYLATLYPGQRVVIADGSHPSYSDAYDAAVSDNADRLEIEYERYPHDLPFTERLVDCLSKLQDDIIIVGADDDFPVLEPLRKGVRYLRAHEDHVLVIGGIVSLFLDDGRFSARLLQGRSIQNATASRRLIQYSQWPFATSYAATRRTHFLERCKNAELGCMTLFGDHNVAFHDCMAGKIRAFPEICYFTTKLPTHSRLEKPGRLHYLENAKEILGLHEYYKEQLLALPEVELQEAEAVADRFLGMKIAHFAGGGPHGKKGFGYSPLFTENSVRKQYQAFHDLFTDGTPTHEKLGTNLRLIVDAMQQIYKANTDNYGEPQRYSSIKALIDPANSEGADTGSLGSAAEGGK